MAISVSLGLEDVGPVVRHRADAGHREELRRVGERLREAAHPGVVIVLRSAPAEDGWELVTAHAGHALTTSRVTGAAHLAAVGASAASTLADLHQRGLVHGRLSARRVLLGSGRSVTLCGLGPGGDGSVPADDVAALGRVVSELADGLEAEGRASPQELRALRRVVGAAISDPSTRRPSARRLVDELTTLAVAPPRASATAGPRAWRVALAGLAAAGVILGAAWAGSASTDPADRRGAVPTTSTPPPIEPVEAGCVARAGRPVGAAACGHDVVVDDGVVVVDGQRSLVGTPGDVVVVGQWECRTLRPALLRPSTGEVLVLSAAEPGGELHVERSARIELARDLTSTVDALGCPQLLVRLVDGATVPLPVDP